jgi:hypothetical protein
LLVSSQRRSRRAFRLRIVAAGSGSADRAQEFGIGREKLDGFS